MHSKKKALLLIGATGGIGHALLENLNDFISLSIVPTYRTNRPQDQLHDWKLFDTCDFEQIEKKLLAISQEYEIDLIIDASGAFFASKLLDSTVEEVKRVIETNLTAPLILARSAMKYLNQGGKLIFLSSVVSKQDLFGSSVYASSKIGLEKSVTTLAREFSNSNLEICAIRLGYMNYGMTFKLKEEFRLKLQSTLPESSFTNIDVLAKLIHQISSTKNRSNGKIFEVK